MKKTDLRVIKTKNILYNTLIDIMRDKQFEDIKVSDICEKALVNRSTFYAHFSDKYELFSSYIGSLKESLLIELDKNKSITNSKEYYMELIGLFFNHIMEKKDVYKAIMRQNRNSIIMDMVYNAFSEDITKINEMEENNNNEIPANFVATFYIGAIFVKK